MKVLLAVELKDMFHVQLDAHGLGKEVHFCLL